MHAILTAAVKRATKREISGKDVTPFILDHIRRTTGGTSVEANKALVLSNAKQAAKMAVELAKLELSVFHRPRNYGLGLLNSSFLAPPEILYQ